MSRDAACVLGWWEGRGDWMCQLMGSLMSRRKVGCEGKMVHASGRSDVPVRFGMKGVSGK